MGLLWILFGIIAGAIAKWIIPGEGPAGILGDLVTGVIGAFLGSWIYSRFGYAGVTGFNLASIVCAVIGALVLLWALRLVSRSAGKA